jgi:hypothetical protein
MQLVNTKYEKDVSHAGLKLYNMLPLDIKKTYQRCSYQKVADFLRFWLV